MQKAILRPISEMIPEEIIRIGKKYLNKPYDRENFNCWHFVKAVYDEADIQIPMLHEFSNKISEENIGYVIYLNHKEKKEDDHRKWTHCGILLPENYFLHCSEYIENKVTVTPLSEILNIYNLA